MIKYKKRTPGHKKLLNLFDDLSDTILTDKTSESQGNEKVKSRKEENKDEDYENENEDEDETMSQIIIKNLNDNLDKIIGKSKSFEDQIESLKKVENLNYYYYYYYGKDFDDKELKYKYFKLKLAHLSNEIEKNLFEKTFGHTLIKLVDKLINTTNREENQVIIENINANKIKINEREKTSYDYVIQPSY